MDLGKAIRELTVEPVQWPQPVEQPSTSEPERVEEPVEPER